MGVFFLVDGERPTRDGCVRLAVRPRAGDVLGRLGCRTAPRFRRGGLTGLVVNAFTSPPSRPARCISLPPTSAASCPGGGDSGGAGGASCTAGGRGERRSSSSTARPSRATTAQARSMSAALCSIPPTASRRTTSPASFVWMRKHSPESFTRSLSRMLAAFRRDWDHAPAGPGPVEPSGTAAPSGPADSAFFSTS